MDQELRNRLKGAFVSGLVTAALSAVLAPGWILLAALAGFAAGFVFYDVREFAATATAVAVEQFPLIYGTARHWMAWAFHRVRKEVNRPHPIEAAAIAVGVVVFGFTIILMDDPFASILMVPFTVFISAVYGITLGLIFLLIFWGLVVLGAEREGKFFRWDWLDDPPWRVTCHLKQARGLQPAELTNRNGFRWMAKGAGVVMFWLLRVTMTAVIVIIGGVLVVLPAFAVVLFGCAVHFVATVLWKTVIRLHAAQRGRVAAGVDGVLGGLIARYAASPETTVGSVLTIIDGTLIGMALAVAGHLLAKRYREAAPEAPAVG